MKRVLIAGKGSYLGGNIADWLKRAPDRFFTRTLDVRGEDWRTFDFAGFDAVVLVAGIAHQREILQREPRYDAVNHVLAVEVAKAAKAAGVRQFVFFSSMSVYGLTTGRITADTVPNPTTAYGRTKLAAERDLAPLADAAFQVAVLRPPMIYGKGCRGNYPRLAAMVDRLPAFPRVTNERSMLYVETLCAFMDGLLESGAGGLYFPQNRAYVTTAELARQIALAHGRRLWLLHSVGWLIGKLSYWSGSWGKVFGTLTYDQRMSDAFRPAQELSFADTIRATEAKG
ncbi:MAG: NAD-dependent epimerase/dehydratase family protein [Eubacteriales bacterium]|nr:NAD-dependent epimerase/dehydratase family protein [Eubacteriales bacterium]